MSHLWPEWAIGTPGAHFLTPFKMAPTGDVPGVSFGYSLLASDLLLAKGVAVPPHFLMLNYRFHVSSAQFERAAGVLAGDFSRVPGLMRGLWLINEARSEGGGLYIFEDESSLRRFLEGPLASLLTDHPALSDVSLKHYSLMEQLTTAEHDPLCR